MLKNNSISQVQLLIQLIIWQHAGICQAKVNRKFMKLGMQLSLRGNAQLESETVSMATQGLRTSDGRLT